MKNNLPDLSTWHPVPAGGVIRKDERYAIIESEGRIISIFTCQDDWRVYAVYADGRVLTEHPITPPLPTEDGAKILMSSDELPPSFLLTLEAGRWVNRYGAEWSADQITSWAPVTIGETVVIR